MRPAVMLLSPVLIHLDLSTQWILDELLEWPEGGLLVVGSVHVASVATDGSQITHQGVCLTWRALDAFGTAWGRFFRQPVDSARL
jgi:hypothetical protein